MTRRFARIAAVLLALGLALSGCGKQEQKIPGLPDLRALLAKEYETTDIFNNAGLPVKSGQPVQDEAGRLYFPVDSDSYKTVADLKKLVDSVYTQAAGGPVLATVSADGGLLYQDIDGMLCRSANPVIQPPAGELDSDTLKVTKAGLDGKKPVAWFTIKETTTDGGINLLEWQVIETKNGWRLTQTRANATSTKQSDGQPGGGEDPAQDEEYPATPQAVAQAFLAALTAGDGKRVGTLSADMGSYDAAYLYPDFQGYDDQLVAGITTAEITQTMTEEEQIGEYQVKLTTGGDSLLKSGDYQLTVGMRESKLVVTSFRPAAEQPYDQLPPEQRTSPAMNQVLDMLTLYGPVTFASPKELNSSILTEYALYHLTQNEEAEITTEAASYTQEQVQAAIGKLFGIQNQQLDSQFHSSEAGGYVMWGRGGTAVNFRIQQLQDANGIALVEVSLYGDPLQLDYTGKVLYTLSNNWDGTYEFTSAQRQDV